MLSNTFFKIIVYYFPDDNLRFLIRFTLKEVACYISKNIFLVLIFLQIRNLPYFRSLEYLFQFRCELFYLIIHFFSPSVINSLI